MLLSNSVLPCPSIHSVSFHDTSCFLSRAAPQEIFNWNSCENFQLLSLWLDKFPMNGKLVRQFWPVTLHFGNIILFASNQNTKNRKILFYNSNILTGYYLPFVIRILYIFISKLIIVVAVLVVRVKLYFNLSLVQLYMHSFLFIKSMNRYIMLGHWN